MIESSGLLGGRFRPLLSVYFLVFTSFFYSMFSSFESGSLEGKAGESIGYQILFLVVYGLLSYKLVRSWETVLDKLLHSAAFLLLIENALVSYLLVGVEAVSLMRFSLYIGTIFLALFIAVTYKCDDVLTTFFWTSAFILMVHFLLFPFFYKTIKYDNIIERTTLLGTLSYGGLFSKEAAGELFAFSAIVAFPRCFQAGVTLTARLILAGSVLAVILAGAMGPLISLILAFAVGIQIQSLYSGRTPIAIVSILTTISLAPFIYYIVGVNQVLGLFHRSDDLTGRDILFHLWPRFFAEHPIFGYGFNGFFNGQPGAPEERLWEFVEAYQKFGTFESGYVEILIQFGIIGGIIYCVIILKAFSNAFYFSQHDKSESRYVPITMLVFILFSNIAEASLMLQNCILPVLLFWIYFGRREKPRPSAEPLSRQEWALSRQHSNKSSVL